MASFIPQVDLIVESGVYKGVTAPAASVTVASARRCVSLITALCTCLGLYVYIYVYMFLYLLQYSIHVYR